MKMINKPKMNKTETYEVDIDFDAAAEAWSRNKIKQPNGCYKYKCMGSTLKGLPCSLRAMPFSEFCKKHSKKISK
jgi:hypothetical protein